MWGSTCTFTGHCATTEVFKTEGHFVGDLLDAAGNCNRCLCTGTNGKSFDIIADMVFHICH